MDDDRIHAVHLEALQAALNRPLDEAWAEIHFAAVQASELGINDHLGTVQRLEHLSKALLTRAHPIVGGRVEEVDALVECGANHALCL